MRTVMRTCAPAASNRTASSAAGTGGFVSRISRWRVQSPPFSTFDGTPGRGVIEPNAPPPPWNWNAVT